MRRRGVAGTPIGWRLDRVDDRPAAERERSPLRGEPAELLEVSVTGARVRAPFTAELRAGSRTVMEVAGVSGIVIIRHIGACTDLTCSVYGVEFAEPNSELTALVYDSYLADPARIEKL